MHLIIDLLDTDGHIPTDLPEDCVALRSYGVPNDNDLAIRQTDRILADVRERGIVPDMLTVFVPLHPYAFGIVQVLGQQLFTIPKVIVQKGCDLFDLSDFREEAIKKEATNATHQP